jgi:anaerobic selenocysteine-containing dehydrogenase
MLQRSLTANPHPEMIMKTVTACTLDCPDACSLVVEIDEQGRIHIDGNPAHPFTAGFTCAKIKRFGERLLRCDRITTPLLRTDNGWQPLTWDAALDLCAEQIQRNRHEPESILHIHGGADGAVLSRFGDLFFARLGSSLMTGNLCSAAGTAGCKADFGSCNLNDPVDLLNAHTIVNWGKDLSRSSVHLGGLVAQARKRGARTVTISPGADGNAAFSDETIRIRPGADRFLAAAILRLFVQRGIPLDIERYTASWDAFRQLIQSRGVAEWAAPSGVHLTDVERLYELYAQNAPVATIVGCGLQRYAFGGETVRFINALALVAGHIGRPGGGSYYSQSTSGAFNLAWANFDSGTPRRSFPRPLISKVLVEAKDPPIRMMWIQDTNIVNQAADSRGTARAFEAVEFKVAVDAFMNDTTERADLILPAALLLEKEDLVGSSLHPWIHYTRPAVPPPAGARTDAWIVRELGKRLDPPIELPEPEGALRMSLQSPHLNTTLEELREKNFVRVTRGPIAFEGLHFDHPDGRYHFPAEIHDQPATPDGYPLRLLSLLRRESLHSQIAPEEQAELPKVWVSLGNPVLNTLDLTQPVFLASPLGRMPVQVQTSSDVHAEVVLYRRGDWMKFSGGVNQVIAADITDMGDGAPYYDQFVRLEN